MECETRRAGVERTLTAVLRGPVTAGLVARDAAVSLTGWAAGTMRVLHDRLSDGIEDARETGRVTLAELRPLSRVNGAAPNGASAPADAAATPSEGPFAARRIEPAQPAPQPKRAGPDAKRTRVEAAADTTTLPPPPHAITDYDQLSALQVVERLEGLAAPELDEVRAYEAARRGRRTILAKVDQLQRSA